MKKLLIAVLLLGSFLPYAEAYTILIDYSRAEIDIVEQVVMPEFSAAASVSDCGGTDTTYSIGLAADTTYLTTLHYIPADSSGEQNCAFQVQDGITVLCSFTLGTDVFTVNTGGCERFWDTNVSIAGSDTARYMAFRFTPTTDFTATFEIDDISACASCISYQSLPRLHVPNQILPNLANYIASKTNPATNSNPTLVTFLSTERGTEGLLVPFTLPTTLSTTDVDWYRINDAITTMDMPAANDLDVNIGSPLMAAQSVTTNATSQFLNTTVIKLAQRADSPPSCGLILTLTMRDVIDGPILGLLQVQFADYSYTTGQQFTFTARWYTESFSDYIVLNTAAADPTVSAYSIDLNTAFEPGDLNVHNAPFTGDTYFLTIQSTGDCGDDLVLEAASAGGYAGGNLYTFSGSWTSVGASDFGDDGSITGHGFRFYETIIKDDARYPSGAHYVLLRTDTDVGTVSPGPTRLTSSEGGSTDRAALTNDLLPNGNLGGVGGNYQLFRIETHRPFPWSEARTYTLNFSGLDGGEAIWIGRYKTSVIPDTRLFGNHTMVVNGRNVPLFYTFSDDGYFTQLIIQTLQAGTESFGTPDALPNAFYQLTYENGETESGFTDDTGEARITNLQLVGTNQLLCSKVNFSIVRQTIQIPAPGTYGANCVLTSNADANAGTNLLAPITIEPDAEDFFRPNTTRHWINRTDTATYFYAYFKQVSSGAVILQDEAYILTNLIEQTCYPRGCAATTSNHVGAYLLVVTDATGVPKAHETFTICNLVCPAHITVNSQVNTTILDQIVTPIELASARPEIAPEEETKAFVLQVVDFATQTVVLVPNMYLFLFVGFMLAAFRIAGGRRRR